MKIYTGEKLADNVKIGDPLKLIVNIDKQEQYGLHVTDCLVRDGLGWGEQRLIDSQGCPLDQEILGPFSYDSDRTKASVAFPAHKFPYTTSVYYQCNVRLCTLEEDNCHKVCVCAQCTVIKSFCRQLSLLSTLYNNYRHQSAMVREERSEKLNQKMMACLPQLKCFRDFMSMSKPK